jgi:hypothetical protein
MIIEKLFSKLEANTARIFSEIRGAVEEGCKHIDIPEKAIQTLFSFMNVSPKRSQQYRDQIQNVHRENDFMFQDLEESYKKKGLANDPHQVWLAQLLYLLEHSHEELLADATKDKSNIAAYTYKHFIDTFALQIWKAADGYEFFINDRLVDFEGDTQSRLGTRTTSAGPQLFWMTSEDPIHLILPISPEVALVFCDESRCWESPFAEAMHQAGKPYPANSLLKEAPHKDIVDVHVPKQKRGKKTWPATTAWRVSIGTLSREHHRIVASYSLSHTQFVLVVRSRKRFEKAKRELEEFSKERNKPWKTQGFQFAPQKPQSEQTGNASQPDQKRLDRMVDEHEAALNKIAALVADPEPKPLKRTKDGTYMAWLAVRTIKYMTHEKTCTNAPKPQGMHPAIKAAFIAAYPPQHMDHRKLIAIDFVEFLDHGIGEETYTKLFHAIDTKISDLVGADTFWEHWAASAGQLPEIDLSSFPPASADEMDAIHQNVAFLSMTSAAEGFETLMWLFEERQDILATFVQKIAVPVADLQPQVTRFRGRRE